MIPPVHSIKIVERQYSTGEEPLLVLCSDMCEYVCKYADTIILQNGQWETIMKRIPQDSIPKDFDFTQYGYNE